jgi:transposase
MGRGRPFVVEWRDSAEDLKARYGAERDPKLARRWQALWLVRTGRGMAEVAVVVGVAYRTIQEWVGWYRQGGLAAVAQHRRGGNRRPVVPLLTTEQAAAVQAEARTHGFATQETARAWIQAQLGVQLTPKQMRRVAADLQWRRKLPRPLAAKADLEQQAAWKKGA